MRLSCQSDTYQKGHRYGGVIIYLYNGKSDWRTANNTHCLSGYIVIQDTDFKKSVKQWRNEPGQVHGAVYRNTFGESWTTLKSLRWRRFYISWKVWNGFRRFQQPIGQWISRQSHKDEWSVCPLPEKDCHGLLEGWRFFLRRTKFWSKRITQGLTH